MMEENKVNQFCFTTSKRESTMTLKVTKKGAKISKFCRSGTLGGALRVSGSGSQVRSGQGRRLGVGSKSASGSPHHSEVIYGGQPARAQVEVDSGGLGRALEELGRSSSM